MMSPVRMKRRCESEEIVEAGLLERMPDGVAAADELQVALGSLERAAELEESADSAEADMVQAVEIDCYRLGGAELVLDSGSKTDRAVSVQIAGGAGDEALPFCRELELHPHPLKEATCR